MPRSCSPCLRSESRNLSRKRPLRRAICLTWPCNGLCADFVLRNSGRIVGENIYIISPRRWHGFRRQFGSQANPGTRARMGVYAAGLSRAGHAWHRPRAAARSHGRTRYAGMWRPAVPGVSSATRKLVDPFADYSSVVAQRFLTRRGAPKQSLRPPCGGRASSEPVACDRPSPRLTACLLAGCGQAFDIAHTI
jgi:hypothetical protein